MTNLRTRVIIMLCSLALAIVAIIVVGSWWLRRSRQTSPPPPPPVSSPAPLSTSPTGEGEPPAPSPLDRVLSPSPPPVVPSSQPSPRGHSGEGLVSIAFSFAEVYGSFSNQGGFDNLERLRFLMSGAMNQWTDDFIARRDSPAASGAQPSPLYYGITTKALSSEVVALPDPDHATVRVSTQRKEVRGVSANARFILEDLMLKFVREDSVWKVESAEWSNRRVLSIEPAAL